MCAAIHYDSDKISSKLNSNIISAPSINADTRRNFDNINIAAGILGNSGDWASGGSASINILNNINTVNITDNKIKTDNFNSNVHNDGNIVNVAGQGAWSGKVAFGAAFALNNMNNSASSIINGSSFNSLSKPMAFNTNVLNDTASTAVAASGSVSQEGSSGNVSLAMNFGQNSTQAIIDKSKSNSNVEILNAKNVDVSATDKNRKFSLAGTTVILCLFR